MHGGKNSANGFEKGYGIQEWSHVILDTKSS
jgi:hypothetical protein